MNPTIYRFYSKADQKQPRVSVVGTFDAEMHLFKFAACRCSKSDKFSRKIGRTIAEGRLRKNQFILAVSQDISGKEFVECAKVLADEIMLKPSAVHPTAIYNKITVSKK